MKQRWGEFIGFAILFTFGIFAVGYVHDQSLRFEDRVCHVVLTITAPIKPPPGLIESRADVIRRAHRNMQLADERARLLVTLKADGQC